MCVANVLLIRAATGSATADAAAAGSPETDAAAAGTGTYSQKSSCSDFV